MNKRKVISIIAALLLIGTYAVKKLNTKTKADTKIEDNISSSSEKGSYWTCSMHPQIHSDNPGECPICHMKLVLVKAQKENTEKLSDKSTSRSEVHTYGNQIELLGIQSHKVEKMTLVVRIPISGRILSSNSVAFQIYESDLRYIKAGLHFKGTSGLMPDEEISGTIVSVDNIVDSSSRTVRVVGSIQKSSQRLVPETSFRGEIQLELKDRLAIPASSVLHTGSGDLVYLMDEKKIFRAKKVILGLKTDSFYEVLSGLNLEDTISSGPNFLIDSEAQIRGTNQ